SLTTTTGSLNRCNPHTHIKTDNFREGLSGLAKGVHFIPVVAVCFTGSYAKIKKILFFHSQYHL
ncbi:MAG: hypothetical protein U9R17_03530, partial [Thermodesulfobacteriota bacterium]|nr:hypothetical protein [Thermodesulfobacteriota bacterium]